MSASLAGLADYGLGEKMKGSEPVMDSHLCVFLPECTHKALRTVCLFTFWCYFYFFFFNLSLMSEWIQLQIEAMNYELVSESDIHFTLEISQCSVLFCCVSAVILQSGFAESVLVCQV